MKVFCVIPAYNEEETIARVIDSVRPFVEKIVVVDDGSRDSTCNLAEEKGAVVLKHIINRGQGAALRTGNEYAIRKGADIIVHFDADGQFLAEEIRDVVRPIEKEGYDVVLGSRFLGKKSEIPRFKKNVIIPIARIINKILMNSDLTDPQCGFRAMKKDAVREVRIEQDGMAHANEILAKIHKKKLRMKEVPITVVYNDFGQKFSGGIRILKDLFLGKLT